MPLIRASENNRALAVVVSPLLLRGTVSYHFLKGLAELRRSRPARAPAPVDTVKTMSVRGEAAETRSAPMSGFEMERVGPSKPPNDMTEGHEAHIPTVFWKGEVWIKRAIALGVFLAAAILLFARLGHYCALG